MPVHPERIHKIMRYAVGVASNADDPQRRELGPIHLIKYAYLGDLAYAAAHDGETYTGAPWRFHHFGPWTTEVWKEIEPAMTCPLIRHRSFRGRFQDDVSRWRSEDPELEERLERELPFPVARAVRAAVRVFGNDTPSLLHNVYRTPPMLHAAPEEALDFSTSGREHDFPRSGAAPEKAEAPLSKTAQKRRRAAHEDLRRRFQDALRRRQQARSSMVKPRPPRYDEVAVKGQEWLDSCTGSAEKQLGV
jgi:hypothetical protein